MQDELTTVVAVLTDGSTGKNLMQKIYKFLPENHVSSLLSGEILFRNLVYFKTLEFDPRADLFEGMHIDAPNHDVHIDNLTTGKRITGRFAFHNTSEHMDRIFCFCTSIYFDKKKLEKFGNSCVEIRDADAFKARLKLALKRHDRVSRLDRPILLADPVTYYDVDAPAPPHINVKNPLHLPFLKQSRYADEQEFRFVFARRGGFKLKQMIVTQAYNECESVATKTAKETMIHIGSIDDIASRVA